MASSTSSLDGDSCTDFGTLENHVVSRDVAIYKDIPARRLMAYRVKRVVSPFEFYVEYSLGGDVEGYDDWFSEMQDWYDKPDAEVLFALETGVPSEGRCYVTKEFTTDLWHRVRVHGINKKESTALVFLCDLGKRQLVKFSDLLEIHPRFCKWAAQLFRAYLYDILPIDGSLGWSPEICDAFEETVAGREFFGIVMCRSDDIVVIGYPEVFTNLGLVLFEQEDIAKNSTLNAMMVKKGVAKAIGIFAASDNLFVFEGDEPVFDKNRLDLEFPEKKLEETPSTSQNLKPKKKTWAPWCDDLQDGAGGIRSADELFQNTFVRLPEALRQRLAQIRLSYVLGPHYILVHLENRVKDLQNLEATLTRAVEAEKALEESDLRPGRIMACAVFDSEKTSRWCRGVVKSIANKIVEVFLVDHGNYVRTTPNLCRGLPGSFLEIPSFVLRLHLDVPGLRPATPSGWSDVASVAFRKYLFVWQSDEPVYLMFRATSEDSRIELSDFSQEIVFQPQTKSWIAGKDRWSPANKWINQYKQHPMFRTYFYSVGVQLQYEVIVQDCNFWFFKPIQDDLLKSGFAVQESQIVNKARIHLAIVETATSDEIEVRSEEI